MRSGAVYALEVDPAFGTRLKQKIAAKRLSLREFAQQTRTSPATLSLIISGERHRRTADSKRRRSITDHFEPWADALGLRGAERDEFLLDCWLATAPPLIRSMIADLRVQAGRRSRGH